MKLTDKLARSLARGKLGWLLFAVFAASFVALMLRLEPMLLFGAAMVGSFALVKWGETRTARAALQEVHE